MTRPAAWRAGNILLFGITAGELALLFALTPTFRFADWVYVLQHSLVLLIAFWRRPPELKDLSVQATAAVFISYSYAYAQVAYLRLFPGDGAWLDGGNALVPGAALLSLASLLSLGRSFGVWPASRGLMTGGPYRLVRHPMYLSYVIADVGYNLLEWNQGTLLMVLAGWGSLLYRIIAEEKILSQNADWKAYSARVRFRLIPGIW